MMPYINTNKPINEPKTGRWLIKRCRCVGSNIFRNFYGTTTFILFECNFACLNITIDAAINQAIPTGIIKKPYVVSPPPYIANRVRRPANNVMKLQIRNQLGTQSFFPADEINAGPVPTTRIVANQSALEANHPTASAIAAEVSVLCAEILTITASHAT